MIAAYKEMWTRYFDFKGKTLRRDYWLAFLADIIVTAILGVVVSILVSVTKVEFLNSITGLYGLAVLIPSISITIRRFRDAGLSWLNIFWVFLPIVGWVIVVIKLLKPSK